MLQYTPAGSHSDCASEILIGTIASCWQAVRLIRRFASRTGTESAADFVDDDCVSREWHIADALAGSGGREPKAEAADSAGWDPDAVTEASERRPRVARDPLVVDMRSG